MNEKENNNKSRERELGPLLLILMICILIPLAAKFHGLYLDKCAEYTDSINEEASLRKEISMEKKRLRELKSEETFIKTDDGVERAARAKLGLIKKGEIPFVLDKSSGKEEEKTNNSDPGSPKVKQPDKSL